MKSTLPDTTTCLLILHGREDRKLKTIRSPAVQRILVNALEIAVKLSAERDAQPPKQR